MVFSSTLFLFVYLPIVLLIYYMCPLNWRNPVLLVFNLIFYGWGEPIYLFLMVASILMDYWLGLSIGKNRDNPAKAKNYLIISLALNLGTLFFFKYLDFVIENLRLVPGLSGLEPLGLVLPIGISFYTFQKMSYIIDVYRNETNAQKSFVSFGTYVSLFPQLIAGPIIKYKDVAEQLEDRVHSLSRFADGASIFMVGLTKKLLLANGIGVLFESYQGQSELTLLGAWLCVAAYTFQIYFDFSGYSDMAIGLGKMLGFEFKPNFNYPYISQSISDFWRRWHISMSTWFREYLYIPLGGNQVGKKRWFLNIFLVWLATGIWHGADWNFILWGLYFAVILVLEKLFGLKLLAKLPRILRHLYSLILIMLGWAIFSSTSLTNCAEVAAAMFGGGAGLATATDLYYLKSYLPLLVVLGLASLPFWRDSFKRLPARSQAVLTVILLLAGMVLCTANAVESSYNPFLYFRF